MRIDIPRPDESVTGTSDETPPGRVVSLEERRSRQPASATKQAPAKKPAAKKPAAKQQVPAKRPAAKKPGARQQAPAKKQVPAKKPAAKKSAAKTPVARQPAARKPAARKSAPQPTPKRNTFRPNPAEVVRRSVARRQLRKRRSGQSQYPMAFWVILLSTAMLCLLGLLMVLSATTVRSTYLYGTSGYFFSRQAIFLGIGVVVAGVALAFGPRRLARLAPAGMVLTAGALIAVLIFGEAVKGSRRWFSPGNINVQPSEIAKIVVIVWAARLLASRAHLMHDWKVTILPVGLGLGTLAGLIYLEPDLGTIVVLVLVVGIMLVVADARLDILALASAPVVALLAFAALSGYHADRWGFLDPSVNTKGSNYQLIGSLSSIAGGGWFGVGPGASTAKWGFLPEAHTDGIFAVIGEEMGAIGALSVIALYLLLLGAGMRVARDAHDLFGRLVALGISTLIATQAFVNIGVAVGMLPNKGFTLPFVSYGGSSLLVMLFAVGLLLNIAKEGGTARPRKRRVVAPRTSQPRTRAR